MNRLASALRAVGCASLLVVLAGCAPTPSAEPSATPAAPVTAAPPEEPDEPSVRVPVACDELIPLDDVSAAAGADVEPVSPVVASDQASLAAFAAEQYGQLDCAWSVGELSYDSAGPVVTASVVPGVPASYWDDYTAQLSEATTPQKGFPGESYSTCFASEGSSGCRLDSLIGDYWLSVQVSTASAEVDNESVAAVFLAAANTVAGARPAPDAWPAYASGPRPEGVVDEAAVSAALGATVERAGCGRPAGQLEHTVAFAETGYGTCSYEITGLPDGQSAFVSIDVLPGGAWAFEALRATFTGEVTPLPDAGAGAYTTSGGLDTVNAVRLRDDDIVLLGIWPSGEVPLAPATIASIVTAVA
jgi:hypothetical protein